ncbi:hypothetical protein FRC07_014968 [Ceratobasidium sp. 392]|nr:hypothetical protein FRC07_014968 [Ceratobasidium sp. 392]
MDLFTRLLSLRRRRRRNNRFPSHASSGSSFEYGQPPVNRLSSDFDPHEYRSEARDYASFAQVRSVGIPIRTTSPRSLPVLEHPIDCVPRRARNAILTSPSVKVHRRMLLQRTEFPHADPPRSPRKQSHAAFSPLARVYGRRARSCHRVESVYEDSSDEHLSASPRLEALRQDPSVLSLVSVMDEQGFIPPSVFANSPATPRPAPHDRRRHAHPFSKSTPDLATRTPLRAQRNPMKRNHFNFRINAAPETPPARPRSEFLLPSFPLHIFPSQNRHATPESHSFSSLQAEQGSFSIPGDSSKKPLFSTHKSLTKASDAFRFLQDQYNKALPPTPGVHNPRGPSVNDAVAESSSTPKTAATSRTPRMSFVHEPERQTLRLNDATYNLSPNAGHTSFSAGANTGSHISYSRTISPLGSPLPVLTRIHPYSSSFSRARRGSNHSSSDETTAPSPSRSLSESSHCSPQSAEMSPRTPLTLEMQQGSPVYARMRPLAIVQSPSESSAYEYLQNKKLNLGSSSDDLTGFAEPEAIRTNRALRATSRVHDTQNYDCHVPTHSVYIQSPAREDHQSPIEQSIRIPTREGRAGLGISFDFNSGNDIMEPDSVGDGLDDDQLDITPGRPTVVLVPSGRRSDRSEVPASASPSASVNLKLERAGRGPRLGHDPRFPLESESLSSQSCASSFYTAQEILVEPELDSRTLGHGDGHARNDTSGTSRCASGTPRQTADFSASLHLDLTSNAPLAASAGPAVGISSSSRTQDQLHHGIPPRIGLGVGMDIESRGWQSTSSLTSESSRDEYSRFASTHQRTPVPWSQFVSPSPGSGSARR